MNGKPRSIRQAQALQTTRLREQGRSWAEIAAVFRATYRVNPRVALRQAHGWSQPQAAEKWTARWPEDPKTFKNFSYWEQWPGLTGHAPSLDTLDRLAQLYECKITDLLADCDDYYGGLAQPATAGQGGPDRATPWSYPDHAAAGPLSRIDRADLGQRQPGRAAAGSLPARQGSPSRPKAPAQTAFAPGVCPDVLQAALETVRRAQSGELAEVAGEDEPDSRLRRRTLLLEASSALAVIAAAPVLEVPRLASASAAARNRVGHGVVAYTSEVVAGLRRLALAVGPRITLQPTMALRSAMTTLARSAPEVVSSQALSAYGDLTLLAGWLMFHLGDPKAARYYYDDARTAAYRAGNDELVAYSLGTTSYLALAAHRPQHAIDHAQAARQVARNSGSPFAIGYAADILARAYASAGQPGRCRATLDAEQETLAQIRDDTPRSAWWCFYDRSFYWGTESECALLLGSPADAITAAGTSLALADPQNIHAHAIAIAFRAEALIQQGEVGEACDAIAELARVATMHSSKRIARQVDELRGQLGAAGPTAALRDLDEKLAAYHKVQAADGT